MSRRKNRHLTFQQAFEECLAEVFVVDTQRRLVSVGPGIERLTGWAATEVATLLCEMTSAHEPGSREALASALCPPPEAQAGQVLQVPRFLIHRQTGRAVARVAHFFPFPVNGQVGGVLGILTEPGVVVAGKPSESPATQVHAELAALRQQLRQRYGLSSVVCRSPAMHRVLEQIRLAAQVPGIVHITGEPGTGREHIARAMHYASRESVQAFVPIDCHRLPAVDVADSIQRLIETDWIDVSPITALHPGTVYLEHVNELPRDLQQRLVEFLKTPRGQTFRGKVRLVSSCTQDLRRLMAEERITEEFYFLMTLLRLELPPLRERRQDFRVLAQHFLEKQNQGREKQLTGFSPETWTRLEEYNWPGNLTELEQVVQESAAACDGSQIRPQHLPFRFRTGLEAQSLGPVRASAMEPIEDLLRRVEREHVEEAMRRAKNNRAQAARLLGITRASLYRRLETLGLDADSAEEAPDN